MSTLTAPINLVFCLTAAERTQISCLKFDQIKFFWHSHPTPRTLLPPFMTLVAVISPFLSSFVFDILIKRCIIWPHSHDHIFFSLCHAQTLRPHTLLCVRSVPTDRKAWRRYFMSVNWTRTKRKKNNTCINLLQHKTENTEFPPPTTIITINPDSRFLSQP